MTKRDDEAMWLDLGRVEVIATVLVNGEEVGSFRSEGIAHPTKRMVRLLTRGHSVIDDMRIWRRR